MFLRLHKTLLFSSVCIISVFQNLPEISFRITQISQDMRSSTRKNPKFHNSTYFIVPTTTNQSCFIPLNLTLQIHQSVPGATRALRNTTASRRRNLPPKLPKVGYLSIDLQQVQLYSCRGETRGASGRGLPTVQ